MQPSKSPEMQAILLWLLKRKVKRLPEEKSPDSQSETENKPYNDSIYP